MFLLGLMIVFSHSTLLSLNMVSQFQLLKGGQIILLSMLIFILHYSNFIFHPLSQFYFVHCLSSSFSHSCAFFLDFNYWLIRFLETSFLSNNFATLFFFIRDFMLAAWVFRLGIVTWTNWVLALCLERNLLVDGRILVFNFLFTLDAALGLLINTLGIHTLAFLLMY